MMMPLYAMQGMGTTGTGASPSPMVPSPLAALIGSGVQQGMQGPGAAPTPMSMIHPGMVPGGGGGVPPQMQVPPGGAQAPPGLLQQLGGPQGIQQLLQMMHGQPGAGAPQGQQGLIPQNLPPNAPIWNPQNPVGTQSLGALTANSGQQIPNWLNGQASGLLNFFGLGGGSG